MLCLHIKVGGKLYINNDIVVIVKEISNHTGTVKFAIEAPRNVVVDREEIRKKRLANPNFKKEEKCTSPTKSN